MAPSLEGYAIGNNANYLNSGSAASKGGVSQSPNLKMKTTGMPKPTNTGSAKPAATSSAASSNGFSSKGQKSSPRYNYNPAKHSGA
jgi:hypothetical protein